MPIQTTLKTAGMMVLVALLASLFGPELYGEVRLTPTREIAAVGQMSEPLPFDLLIRTALLASGVAPENLDALELRMTNLVESAPVTPGTYRDRGEKLLIWMHETILKRYIEEQTRVDVLLDKGTYNCVSSAVLYLILAREQNIPVIGVLTTDHAFCHIPMKLADGEDDGIDVETTTPYGFDPGRRLEAVDSFTGRTGFRYVPRGNYRQRRDIGERELISLIYQNRMASLQKTRGWEDAVGLALDRFALSGSEAAAADFRNSITNFSAAADRENDQVRGLEFLNDAAAVLGPDHRLETNAMALLGNAVTLFLRSGDLQAAENLLDDPELTALVPDDFLEDRRREIGLRNLDVLVKTLPFPQGVDAVDQGYGQGIINRARWEEFSLFLWSGEARKVSTGGRWLVGWQLLRSAPELTRSIARWKALEETYLHNSVVDYHNRFVTAFRGRRISEARAILDEGLSFFPEAPLLKEDLKTLSRTE